MPAKKETTAVMDPTISAKIAPAAPKKNTAKVFVTLPLREDSGSGFTEDQNEYVTINGKTTKVPRGEPVEVTVPVYIQLRNRYPSI